MRPRPLSDLHTHLEGSLPLAEAVRIAREREGHPWQNLSERDLAGQELGSFDRFLEAIRAMCSLLCSEEALELTARELSLSYGEEGLRHAEVYVSPHIYERWGMKPEVSMAAVERGFRDGENQGGTPCRILLDSVRQWGVEAARAVLDGYERHRWPRVVGFGLGGEESGDLREFADTYDRARSLGLGTVVHAAEFGPAADVAIAIEVLEVDRIAHGIRAVEDEGVLRLLAASGVPLDLAISSNYATGAVEGEHPIGRLVEAGVPVTVGADDPALFGVTPGQELARLFDLGLTRYDIDEIIRNGVRYAFLSEPERRRILEETDR